MTIRYENRRHAIADRVMAAYEWLHLRAVTRRARPHTVTPAELQAMQGLAVRYPEAYAHLLAQATATPIPPSSPDHLPQVAEAPQGGTPRG